MGTHRPGSANSTLPPPGGIYPFMVITVVRHQDRVRTVARISTGIKSPSHIIAQAELVAPDRYGARAVLSDVLHALLEALDRDQTAAVNVPAGVMAD